MFEDQSFFGMARTGVLEDGRRYPLILDNDELARLVPPDGFSIPYSVMGGKLWVEMGDIVVIPEAIRLIQRPLRFLETIRDLFNEFGFRKLIYAQGIGDPYLMPVLAYAGITIFDGIYQRMEAINGIGYGPLGKHHGKDSSGDANVQFSKEILNAVAMGISDGTLREIVEKFMISSKAQELLRLIDSRFAEQTEETFPARTPYIKANSVEALSRPDLTRFRNYVAEKYEKPTDKKVALIIPCSARKPYSESKTHQSLIASLGRYREFVHEIIVTSPMGLVPRELEEAYPPRFYDIPVTGRWFEEEKQMIRNMLSLYFARNSYSHIFCLIDESLNFIRDALPENSTIINGRIDRESDQKRLKENLEPYSGRTHDRIDEKRTRLIALAEYQFGKWISRHLEKSRIQRNYNQFMFVQGGLTQLVFNEKKGSFSINKSFAKPFIDENRFVVSIDDFKPTSNVYAAGVLGVTADVRPECEVVLSFNGEPRGAGTAKMPSRAMIELSKGIAVKVR
ncbi:MAG: DUF5591 domain-containing protein [Thermoplasmataceae archaeon]